MSKPFSKKQLQTLQHALHEKKEHLQQSLTQLLQSQQSTYTNEISKIDNHIADQATELYDQERDMGLHDHFIELIEQTERALDKLAQGDEGDYGYCEDCHEPISFERLQAIPDAQYCIQHQPQPIQELKYEQVNRSFAESNNDERDATYFDGEDTNQALFQYGTSAISENQNFNYDFSEEFDDCFQNGVEQLEDFIATDITGKNVYILRNEAYKHFVSELDNEQQ